MSDKEEFTKGSLAVVAVPLGNPGDITQRAVRTLAQADLVAAEDTRSAKRLLAEHGLTKKLVSYHDWNEAQGTQKLMASLKAGERVALISEAGTPGISDPGFDVVREARRSGVKVFPVPGACALTAFLSVCGLPTDKFTFLGFAPPKSQKRKNFFAQYAERPETLIFYEAPHRIIESLEDAREVFGDRLASLGREITKEYEEFFYSNLSGVIEGLKKMDRVRGEITWGLSGWSPDENLPDDKKILELAKPLLEQNLPIKKISSMISDKTAMSAKDVYKILIGSPK